MADTHRKPSTRIEQINTGASVIIETEQCPSLANTKRHTLAMIAFYSVLLPIFRSQFFLFFWLVKYYDGEQT